MISQVAYLFRRTNWLDIMYLGDVILGCRMIYDLTLSSFLLFRVWVEFSRAVYRQQLADRAQLNHGLR